MTERVVFLESEVAFWRARAETLEVLLREAGKFSEETPPEPPLGTEYWINGHRAWSRREDGWHCWDTHDCRNCPCEWLEAWDMGLRGGRHERRLP